MSFGEKLLALRKENGLSQEALAEKLNTSRQAISKWENGQGYPETEKIIMISTIFEVSTDFLLKDNVSENDHSNDGYYVSKEKVEGYLDYYTKVGKSLSLGFSLLILSVIPYLVFKDKPEIYVIPIILLATLGLVTIVSVIVKANTDYEKLDKKMLLLDSTTLQNLMERYENVKRKNAFVIGLGVALLIISFLGFLLERQDIALGVLVPYYPLFVAFIAIGVFILVRKITIISAYSIFVKNKEHMERLEAQSNKKWRKKLNEWF
ncbi:MULTISPECIES: helix-turn-helix domain-containing protein [Sutcliffiella]|uniref:helix-turn-helix domain-containing protein n=1 Tax=Sutcliffiella TaxID=2837511 RepID=UPI0022DDA344|nr:MULTISPECIES: helix-turn-helix transcriptional regulator [Sutcliffiella]MED4017896.1 helix-turn-helix transcriptional regulator [Sutcliffiella cohnii]WBL16600.1 helix-turn-helix transcriptional regulator [Sutcliffiella sp. NC1]